MPSTGTMNRMYMSQIINPKSADPLRRSPLICGSAAGSAIAAKRMRPANATGAAARSARNTERRDHSICPSDKSKMRTAVRTRVGRAAVVGSICVLCSLCVLGLFHQVLEHGLKIVVGRGDLVNRAELARCREGGQPCIERVRPGGLDDRSEERRVGRE